MRVSWPEHSHTLIKGKKNTGKKGSTLSSLPPKLNASNFPAGSARASPFPS